MGFKEKVKAAKPTTWPADGLPEEVVEAAAQHKLPADDSAPITATYLWCDDKPMPDGILLKDASALVPEGKSRRVESYGRNRAHYARELAYARLVTRMYALLSDGDKELFTGEMENLGLEVPE